MKQWPMPNFISEDDIEQAILRKLSQDFGFELLNCYTSDADDLNDRSGRADKRDVIFADRLKTAALRLNRGSTTTSFALRLRRASMAKRNPTGWFSAGLPPMMRTTSAFATSVQPLVIAPRPKVAARLATVGPCQRRA